MSHLEKRTLEAVRAALKKGPAGQNDLTGHFPLILGPYLRLNSRRQPCVSATVAARLLAMSRKGVLYLVHRGRLSAERGTPDQANGGTAPLLICLDELVGYKVNKGRQVIGRIGGQNSAAMRQAGIRKRAMGRGRK